MLQLHRVAAYVLGMALVLASCGPQNDSAEKSTGDSLPSSGTTDTSSSPSASTPSSASGSTAGSASTPARIGACNLAGAEDISRITGAAFNQGSDMSADGSDKCAWVSSGGKTITLAVHVQDVDNVLAQFQSMPGMEEVSGVGDGAWWNSTLNEFITRKGNRALVVSFNYPGNHRKAAGEIATLAIAKL